MTGTETVLRRAGLLLLLLTLAGCQPTVYLMPTPVAITSGKIDPFEANPALEKSNRARLFYATNRLPAAAGEYVNGQGDRRLRVGEAELKIGSKQTLWEELYIASVRRTREKQYPLRLLSARQMALFEGSGAGELSAEQEAFFHVLNQAIEASPHREITLYVHGANNNFYRGAAQAAQFQHFTGRNAVIMVFAWPSAANLLRYGHDVTQARRAAPVLADLLELLARHSSARHVNLLAYSAGAMVVSPALKELRRRHAADSPAAFRARMRLGEVYYAAPDADFRAFLYDLAEYRDTTCNVTLSVNLNDYVLDLARGYHGTSRAGSPDFDELDEEESRWLIEASEQATFDILDVGDSPIPGIGSAHDFWYHNPWVSSDVLVQLLYHARPAERGLERIPLQEGGVIWRFPPDYPERVVSAVKRLEARGDRGCPGAGTGPSAGNESPAGSPPPAS